MKLFDLYYLLNELNNKGYGNTEITTCDEDSNFYLYLEDINGDEFKEVFTSTPVNKDVKIWGFSYSKGITITENFEPTKKSVVKKLKSKIVELSKEVYD